MLTRQKIEKLTKRDQQKLLAAMQAQEIARCKESFSYFLFKYVKTTDPHTPLTPVKPFPKKKYLVYLAEDLQHGPDIEFIAKSRQLMVSWILCAFTVWRMQFYAHSHCYFQSKKQEDAAEMIYDTVPQKARMSFIMVNLPTFLQVCLLMAPDGSEKPVTYPLDQRTFTYGSILLPNGSFAEALAQGAAQIEGKVPAWLVSDEASLQEEWRASYAAAKPCLAGGGRMRVVATMRLPSDYGHEISTAAEVDPDGEMRGVAKFKSVSGLPALRIHYSADPDKDPATETGRRWFAKETSEQLGGFDSVEWQQHYEINPLSVSGQKCIPYWNQIKDRVVIDDLPIEQVALWKLGAGADYGTRNPTVLILFAIDYHGNSYAVDEIACPAGEVHKMPGITKGGVAGISQLWKQNPLFDRVNGQIQMDPTTDKKDQNDAGGLTSVMQLFGLNGVYLQPAKARGTEADDLTLNRLHEWWAGYEAEDWSPQFFICRRCTGLISILAKAEYADWSPNAQQSNDLKPKMRATVGIDPFDCLKHWVVSLPQGPGRVKAAPPMGSFPYLRNLVLKNTRQKLAARS